MLVAGQVSSFGFGAPLFANEEVQQALQKHSLEGNMFSILKPQDAAPHFLTACSNLFTASDPGHELLPALAEALGETLAQGPRDPGHVQFDPLSLHFRTVHKWTSSLKDEIGKLPRRNYFSLTSGPLDISELLFKRPQLDAAGGVRTSETGTSHALYGAMEEERSSAGSMRSGRISISGDRTSPAIPRGKSNLSGVAAAGDGSNSPRAGGTKTSSSILSGTVKAAAVAEKHAALKAAIGKTGTGSKLSTTSGKTASSPAAATNKTKQGSEKSSASSNDVTDAGSWKSNLAGLLKLVQSAPSLYVPVGVFWLVKDNEAKNKPAASSEASYKQENVSLQQMPQAQVASTLSSWLAESNKELFTKWEYSLVEFKRELMEAFPW